MYLPRAVEPAIFVWTMQVLEEWRSGAGRPGSVLTVLVMSAGEQPQFELERFVVA